MPDILDRLRHAVTTATNDDYSEPQTLKRTRHIERLVAMQDAAAEIETLRSVVFKMQAPENQALTPPQYLTEPEKVAVRSAVSANL